jgi:ribosomal protein S27AE
MTTENPLAIDVATRTTRGRACPRCGGKIIPSDRAVYQGSADPDSLFPVWQCERCGYEEMTARPASSPKKKTAPTPETKRPAAASPSATPIAQRSLPPASLDLQGRPYPPDVLQLLDRLKQASRSEG